MECVIAHFSRRGIKKQNFNFSPQGPWLAAPHGILTKRAIWDLNSKRHLGSRLAAAWTLTGSPIRPHIWVLGKAGLCCFVRTDVGKIKPNMLSQTFEFFTQMCTLRTQDRGVYIYGLYDAMWSIYWSIKCRVVNILVNIMLYCWYFNILFLFLFWPNQNVWILGCL